MAKKQKRDVYHTAVSLKSQNAIAKGVTQKQRREGELLKEYRSLRHKNVFLDRRATPRRHAGRTKAEKFVLEDAATFGELDTLGVPALDSLEEITTTQTTQGLSSSC